MKEIPKYKKYEFFRKRTNYCVCIPVINEGVKIKKQLARMGNIINKVDIFLLDAGSTDGSTNLEYLKSTGIRGILIKEDDGKLSAQLRMGYNYILNQGYDGVVTVDGNGKDSVENIPDFIKYLKKGQDFIQGSRYMKGGNAINTPKMRVLAIKLIHRPIISLLAGFRYTDTTNGFRGYSKKLLEDSRLSIFRNIFETYELLAYLSVRAPRLGFRVIEIPVTREYPKKGKIPTKISFLKGNIKLLKILLFLALGKYNPKDGQERQI